MSRSRQSFKKIFQSFYQKLRGASASTIREQRLWLLRSFLVTKQHRQWVNSGFVLPTVTMVSLVVVLLTVAILFRSFERSKDSRNVRVNEAVLSSATPAIDRARAKIEELFQDPRLPRSTPSDFSLDTVFKLDLNKFTFGDEIPLTLASDFNGTAGIQDEERLTTAWKYPVDTDNNGKFDSYTLYGIYYRTPQTDRPRGAIEARTRPMDEGARGAQCDSEVATSANLVGTQGWYKVGGKLKRSLFTYTTTVPITQENLSGIPAAKRNQYETFRGSKGFTALEYQQDRERIPLNNNAVLYEDDLEIAPGSGININGRIFTNGNLLTREPKSNRPVRFYLVSSKDSCYFNEENNKIVVAGNVINTRANESSGSGDVQVDLFGIYNNTPGKDNINSTNKTVPTSVGGTTAAYNDVAYAKRIDRLVEATIASFPNRTQLPKEVQEEINRDVAQGKTFAEARKEQLKIYFRKRTRRVPYAEVGFGIDPLGTYKTTSPLQGTGDSLRPIDKWVFPFNPNNGTNAAGFAEVGIKTNGGNKVHLKATDPKEQVELNEEKLIGDRILVGNNMPQLWFDSAKNQFVSSPDEGQPIQGKKWDTGDEERQRFSQAYQLDDLGITDRNDFWEISAAQKPQGKLDVVGGTRIITGAGIYLPQSIAEDSGSGVFSSLGTTNLPTVWADSMPMVAPNAAAADLPQYGINDSTTPYLRMRASVVYHYQTDTYDPETAGDVQKPIACVSNYYDPTNSTTAKNRTGLPYNTGVGGRSHNGVVYSSAGITSGAITTYRKALDNQANLKYPNGKLVNEPLNRAMQKFRNGDPLNLENQSAIDSAICALKIFDGTIGNPTSTVVPHGAITETTFLDARQVKAIDRVGSSSATTYDLDVEFRQPLEIRTTALDMDLLRKKAIGTDFLIPNSGIIYASRDDAEPDESEAEDTPEVNATDFRLDPNRRPNGIMLINGSDLSRNDTYKPEEKGLILASNLPVYIKGNFNLHTQEEFSDIKLKEVRDWGDNFYRRKTLNPQFACRKGQFPTCTVGETWRPASILSDGITVLSGNFQEGFRNEGDYDLRDNQGYAPFGYDLNGDGDTADSATLSEADLRIDLNGDGDTADSVTTLNERILNVDINGDGLINSTAVGVRESNIPAVVAARLNGFWNNNFVTSFAWKDDINDSNTYGQPRQYDNSSNVVNSSYFNNFVTPIQRRGDFNEYVMEICRKSTVAACTPDDWVVGRVNGTNVDWTIKAKDLKPNDPAETVDKLGAGTTARPALNEEDRIYPRRVAFLRDDNDELILAGGKPIPLGIKAKSGDGDIANKEGNSNSPGSVQDNRGEINYYPYATYNDGSNNYSAYSSSNRPRRHKYALWFATQNGTNRNYGWDYPLWIDNTSAFSSSEKRDQPLLIPVLQIHFPFATPNGNRTTLSESKNIYEDGNNWLQIAEKTETNVIFAQGNTPARPTESNGGLENFVRYLEAWKDPFNSNWNTSVREHIAQGAFIQFKRSSYANAPWWVFEEAFTDINRGFSPTGTMFGYPQGYRTPITNVGTGDRDLGRSPFYTPPRRYWGYDVALLTQLPDLFSQRFASPATDAPNEYFREVARDDRWVKTLLCAAQPSTNGGYDAAPPNKFGTGKKYAISEEQRPQDCQ